jgi:hypothetical protein
MTAGCCGVAAVLVPGCLKMPKFLAECQWLQRLEQWGFVHRFLVWLDAPGDCMPFVDFDPAHNVRLFKSVVFPSTEVGSAYFAMNF